MRGDVDTLAAVDAGLGPEDVRPEVEEVLGVAVAVE